jgi:hypothetical protein
MRSDIDGALAALAQQQHGVFAAVQVCRAGGDRQVISRRVRSGRWERLSSRVFGYPGTPNTLERRLQAAVLHDPGAVVSHTASARLQRFMFLQSVRAEVTTTYQASNRNPFAAVHKSVDLTEPDIIICGGIRTTSPARTVADLLSGLGRVRTERIIDDLLSSRRMTMDDLIAVHDRYARGGRPTTVAMREIIAARSAGGTAPASVLESMALEVFVRAGLPEPVLQFPLPGWGEGPARTDMAWPEQRVLVELDGRRWHDRDASFETDRERDNAAVLAGWTPFRFTHRHLTERPGYVIRTVSAALERAGRVGELSSGASRRRGDRLAGDPGGFVR